MASIWEATAKLPSFAPQNGDVETDTLIIGGGMTGILLAYELQQRGQKYLLVERGSIGGGTTGGTTAKITVQHGACYQKLLKEGFEVAEKYLAANEDALSRYAALCRGIDCDWTEQDSFLYACDDETALVNELNALRLIGAEAEWCDTPPLPFDTVGAVRMPGQAHFHPLRFLAAIAEDLAIREQTPVRALDGLTAVTDGGRIRARRIVAATRFPILNKHGLYWMKLYQSRSYFIALEGAPAVGGMYRDADPKGLSLCDAEPYLLIGGGAQRPGKPGTRWETARGLHLAAYPEAAERFAWAAEDAMSLDGIPYIGQYAPSTEGLYVAAGFNKWGMTGAMAASRLLADALTGERQPDWADIFNPARCMIKPQLVVNGFASVKGLLTPTAPRCPHLGCALHETEEEHAWECACHGSRFSMDGTLLDGPATVGLPQKPSPKERRPQ